MTVYVVRKHLREVWERVREGGRPAADEREVVSSRSACVVLVTGLWLAASGLPAAVTLVFLLPAFVFFLKLTRAVVESGIPMVAPAAVASGLTGGLLGAPALGPAGRVALMTTQVWTLDLRSFVMGHVANSLRMTPLVGADRRRLAGGPGRGGRGAARGHPVGGLSGGGPQLPATVVL